MNSLYTLSINDWHPSLDAQQSLAATQALESGQVLVLPQLPFVLAAHEQKFLDTRWSDQKSKNISLRPQANAVGTPFMKGAIGTELELAELRGMIQRYADNACSLVAALFPSYAKQLKVANTSYRPFEVENRVSSYRKDDTRLHADAFPSNPTQGTRLLRVFCNINPYGKPRVWRVGEPFADMAAKYLPQTRAMLPLQAWLMHNLGITKKRRTDYDHRMLQLHDLLKADMDYQRHAPQQQVDFMPGTTWVVYSDQVLHAAMSGQFMLEQTFHLPAEALYQPHTAPIHVLKSMQQSSF
jgi:3-deoxy-D-manno-oct-2-ulosonic acid (Kdo) hydroxylase